MNWGLLWRAENILDGKTEHLMWNHRVSALTPMLFRTRAAARRHLRTHYEYIKDRTDLKTEPHGWKMPKVVKVHCVYEVIK